MTIAIKPTSLPASDDRDPGGLARLDFALRGGATRLVRSETRPPLGVMRTLYLDEALPNMAFTFLINPTAGILEGDQQQIEITVRAGAQAHVTTQAATKLFTMPAGTARQTVRLKVEEGGALEYLPDETIPFRGACFEAHTEIEVHTEAVAVVGDVLAAGRSAMGENFAYRNLRYRVTATRPDSVPLFHDAFELAPDLSSPAHRGVLSEHA
ncbi:MAG: urease accessory protein UreD, partial [Chloroflexota bacterium]